MHKLTELPAWERLLKKIVWAQLGDIQEKTKAHELLDGNNKEYRL